MLSFAKKSTFILLWLTCHCLGADACRLDQSPMLLPQSCVEKLWYASAEELQIYNAKSFSDILTRAPELQSLEKNLLFMRIGYYHLANQKKLAFRPENQKAALVAFLRSAYGQLDFTKPELAQVINEWIILVDTAWLAPYFSSELEKILSFYRTTEGLLKHREHRLSLYSLFYLYQRAPTDKLMQGKISEKLLSGLGYFAKHKALAQTPDTAFLVNNAIWALGAVAYYVSHLEKLAQAHLQATLVTFSSQERSEPYHWTINALTRRQDCVASLCKSQVVAKLKQDLFTHKYIYDLSFEVYSSLPKARIDALIASAQRVKKNFSELTGLHQPLPDDPNQTLKIFIYSTKTDYERYHSFLFNLATNNGGIYIEQTGTFYTYQRTEAESTYSLDELFRHEFVHYLVGRYMIPGLWGEVPIYQNHRMVWFDEGIAELLGANAASDKIQSNNRFAKISHILTSSYQSEQAFYSYSAVFLNFIVTNRPEVFANLVASLRKGDVQEWDRLLQNLKMDGQMQKEFETILSAIRMRENRSLL